MPVFVTPVQATFGRRLVSRLLDEGGQVRAVATDRAAQLRQAGAIVAVSAPDDPGRLEAAMAQVHTVVHIPSLLLRSDLGSLRHEAEVVAAAAHGAGVRRLILRSLLGADEQSSDPLRSALGGIERAYAELPLPTVVVRTGLVDEPELRAVLAGTPLPRQLRDTPVGTVAMDDLIEVLARLDAARSNATEGHVLFDAVAPSAAPLGDLVSEWQAGGAPAVYLDPASTPLLASGLSGPWMASAGALDVWEFTGVVPAASRAARKEPSS